MLCKYIRAKIEDTVIEDVVSAIDDGDTGGSSSASLELESTALEGYETLLEKFCSNEADSISHVRIWLHYLTFLTEESGTRDVTFCRKVYKRALTLTTATIMQSQASSHLHNSFLSYAPNSSPGDLLYTHWQTFETRYGEAKDVLHVMNRYRKYSLKLSAAIASSLARDSSKFQKKSTAVTSKKRSIENTDSCNLEQSSKQVQVSKRSRTTDNHSNSVPEASSVVTTAATSTTTATCDDTSTDSAVITDTAVSAGVENTADKMDIENPSQDITPIIPGKYSVFVKNIDFSVTQSELENVFKANKYCSGSSNGYNETDSPSFVVRLTKTTAGKSRGMAHVDFASPEHQSQAMSLHNTILKGRPITVERYVPSAYATVESHPLTVFVKNMTRDTTEVEIKEFLLKLLMGGREDTLSSEGAESKQQEGEGKEKGGDIVAAVKLMKCKRSGNSKVSKYKGCW